jgi:lysophospholipase L1-like esterase
MTRELWFRAALVLVSTLGTLAACEVGLRAYLSMSDSGAEALASLSDAPETAAKVDVGTTGLRGLVRPSRDPELVYELRPNIAGRFKGRPFSISAHGLRDREYPQAKPPEVYRVIGLGDSVAFGWGVPQEASYLEVLERRWTEVGRAIEVLNFAVPGYNTAMEVAAFERKALAFDPDLVLLHFVENDLRLPSFLQPPRKIWTSRTSHLWKLLSERLGYLARARQRNLVAFKSAPDDDVSEMPAHYRRMVGWDGFQRAIERLASLTGPDIPVIVVMLGRAGEPWDEARRRAEGLGFRVVSIERAYSRHLAGQGLEQTPEAWSRAFWVSPDDPHPNALGHELHASVLAPEIEAHLY